MTALYTVSRLGLAAHLTDTTRALLGREPITFRQFARDHVHVWSEAREPPHRARPRART